MVVDGTGSKETRKTTLQSEWRSTLKKSLTEPALLEMSGNPTNQDLTNERTETVSVVVRLCENFVAKAEPRRFDDDFRLRKKIPTTLVRSEFEHNLDGNGSILRGAITR